MACQAVGALNAASEAGVAVPDTLSVVGFDDLPVADWPLIRLTTVAYDLDAMTRAAATLIVDRLVQGPGSPYRRIEFDSRLVRRNTLGPATG